VYRAGAALGVRHRNAGRVPENVGGAGTGVSGPGRVSWPATMPPIPNLHVITATASVFRVRDANDPRFYLFSTLGVGVLRFEVVAKLATGERGSVSGKVFFAAMMAHFGARVKIIEGNWTLASGLTTNLDIVNRATAAGLSKEAAAALTWTGLRASDFGYDQVTVISSDPDDAPGQYVKMQVRFNR
jgi:hypothetical protein